MINFFVFEYMKYNFQLDVWWHIDLRMNVCVCVCVCVCND
jgi:hypothetical protein